MFTHFSHHIKWYPHSIPLFYPYHIPKEVKTSSLHPKRSTSFSILELQIWLCQGFNLVFSMVFLGAPVVVGRPRKFRHLLPASSAPRWASWARPRRAACGRAGPTGCCPPRLLPAPPGHHGPVKPGWSGNGSAGAPGSQIANLEIITSIIMVYGWDIYGS